MNRRQFLTAVAAGVTAALYGPGEEVTIKNLYHHGTILKIEAPNGEFKIYPYQEADIESLCNCRGVVHLCNTIV